MTMNVLTCTQCGEVIPESARRCPVCGMEIPDGLSPTLDAATPCEQRFHELLSRARQCQLAGDLPAAISLAETALSLHCDVCAVHALLGHLYEQYGNTAAAHHHFQQALEVAPGQTETELPMPQQTEPPVAVQSRGVWLMTVLVGCILFSGLAALFTLFPGERTIGQSNILQPTIATPSNSGARWTENVPTPIRPSTFESTREHPAVSHMPVLPSPDNEMVTEKPVLVTPPVALPHVPERFSPTTVLGPAACANLPAEGTEPTVEQGDQAYFHGNFELAVSIYEELMRQQAKPDPRMLQNLAWCYQQLGNSDKAAEQLKMAVQGYRSQLVEDPLNPSAQQGCRSCEAALVSLQVAP